MKKLLIVFLIIPFISFSQGRIFQNCGLLPAPPTGFNTARDILADTCGGKPYKWVSTKWVENTGLRKTLAGKDGTNGTNGVNGVDGKDGVCPPCPPSTGGGGIPGLIIYNPYVWETITDIQVAGTGTNQLIGSNSYPGIVVTSTDLFDWANLQYGLYLSKTKYKGLRSAGIFNINRGLEIAKDHYQLFWNGSSTKIVTQNNNAFAVIYCAQPADMNEALVKIAVSKHVIQFLKIEAQSNQTGISMNCSGESVISDNQIKGAGTGIVTEFCIGVNVLHNNINDCPKSILIDCGHWNGASYASSNAQSNKATVEGNHIYYGTQVPSPYAAIAVYGCSGSRVWSNIIEGGRFKYCIDIDFKSSPNVKESDIRVYHAENVLGNIGASGQEAYIHTDMVGVITISGAYIQYPGCFVSASGNVGMLQVQITQTAWLVPDAQGKLFNNLGNVQWLFYANSYQTDLVDAARLAPRFAGIPVKKCEAGLPATFTPGVPNPSSCGANTYIIL